MTFPFSNDANNSQQSPYWTVNVFLQDADNNPITILGGVTLTFNVTSNKSTSPSPFSTGTLPDLAPLTQASLLSAIKSWAEDMDWNTGVDWSGNYGVTATPVSLASVSIVEIGANPVTDVTP